MSIKVALHVDGFDLRNDAIVEAMDVTLGELEWTARGSLTIATHYSDGRPRDAVVEAVDYARLIHKLPGAVVIGAFDELVGLHDIAVRCSVTRETARTWAKGLRRASGAHPFPAPRQVIEQGLGARTLSLYAWRDVVVWVRDTVGLDPDDGIEYLGDALLAELNAMLTAERPVVTSSKIRALPQAKVRVGALLQEVKRAPEAVRANVAKTRSRVPVRLPRAGRATDVPHA